MPLHTRFKAIFLQRWDTITQYPTFHIRKTKGCQIGEKTVYFLSKKNTLELTSKEILTSRLGEMLKN